jgi:hypothetical protein
MVLYPLWLGTTREKYRPIYSQAALEAQGSVGSVVGRGKCQHRLQGKKRCKSEGRAPRKKTRKVTRLDHRFSIEPPGLKMALPTSWKTERLKKSKWKAVWWAHRPNALAWSFTISWIPNINQTLLISSSVTDFIVSYSDFVIWGAELESEDTTIARTRCLYSVSK